MMKIFKLIEFIKKRPHHFLVNYSINEFDAFLAGYRFHKESSGMGDVEDKVFNEFKDVWLKKKLDLTEHKSFRQCLLYVADNEKKALDMFFVYWEEFLQSKEGKVGWSS